MDFIGSYASLSFPDLKNLHSSALRSCKSTSKIQDNFLQMWQKLSLLVSLHKKAIMLII